MDGRVGGLEGSGNLADDLAVQGARFGMMSDWLQQSSRAGGMATKGTAADPHRICVTGDGAGLTGAESRNIEQVF